MLHRNENSILIKYENDPLSGYTKEEFRDILKKRLSGRVSEAWIFGSFNNNAFNRDSDIDLILICGTELPFPERSRIFDDIYDIGPEIDLLVYNQKEFEKIKINPPSGFWTSVTSTMIRLI